MKYKQTQVPEASTTAWTGLTAKETRERVLSAYQQLIQGKRLVHNLSLGIDVEFERIGSDKTAYGGKIYPAKACLIDILPKLIEVAEYTNWGDRKEKDPDNVVGYLNFKCQVLIDGETRHTRIAVRLKNTGKFHYSIEVNLVKKKE